MILIISDFFDLSTLQVIEWLDYLKKDWFRIDAQDKIEIEFKGEEILIKTENSILKFSEISSCWYRRGYLNLKDIFTTNIQPFDYLQSEEAFKLTEYLYYKLSKLKSLNYIIKGDVNKLIVNDVARGLNILTPKDLIFSNINDLKNELNDNSQAYITKVISGNCVQEFEDFKIYNYTSLIDVDKIDFETFFPSLVQNCIVKKYELRIFYLDGDFFTMAIFSQKDNQTKIDFRNTGRENLNRYVSFKLPKKIEENLHLLMQKIDLNCGSIDMIVTPENEYVFLEVNPVGQFGMVSYPCNYNLEKKIAEYL